jgi:hypothetical protein
VGFLNYASASLRFGSSNMRASSPDARGGRLGSARGYRRGAADVAAASRVIVLMPPLCLGRNMVRRVPPPLSFRRRALL